MTQRFLFKASLLYKDICLEQSRFLICHAKNLHYISLSIPAATLPVYLICPFCFQWRQLGNHHACLRPKRKLTARIRRLLKRESAGKRFNAEKCVMATCHTCNKMSRQPGMNRELLSTLSKNRSTPGSAGKQRTPQSASRPTPKSVVDRTPVGTPRSASSNTSSSPSKSGSAKPSTFTRLKKFLMLKNKQQSKKGGLKDFLSSL
uniref:Si:dkey-184p18.2 n=1 Tax=Cyprinus carpio TaxID=7962 RepID=A0A8C1JNC1_CYPCA